MFKGVILDIFLYAMIYPAYIVAEMFHLFGRYSPAVWIEWLTGYPILGLLCSFVLFAIILRTIGRVMRQS